MNVALIAAAGKGRRMQLKRGEAKAYLLLKNKPLLVYSLSVFEKCEFIDKIVVVTNSSMVNFCKRNIVDAFGFNKVCGVVAGGKERQDSVFNGLKALPSETKVVVVHDGARPFITLTALRRAFSSLKGCDGVVVGVPVVDTIKILGENLLVEKTLEREKLISVQTPQIFYVDVLRKAYEKARVEGYYATDDAALVERVGGKIKVVLGDYENIKITNPFDLEIAERILEKRKNSL